MRSIVPLIFLFFLLPGIVYGYVSGVFKSHKDVIKGMSRAMETMGYCMVMAFCAAFLDALDLALLAPVFVPILMQLGLSPELTQSAYCVGDSTTNIITPLMPYSVALLVLWTIFLVAHWGLGLSLGLQAPYVYP